MARTSPCTCPDSPPNPVRRATTGPNGHGSPTAFAILPVLRKLPTLTPESTDLARLALVGLVAAVLVTVGGPQALGQRIHFPSPLSTGPGVSNPGTATGTTALPTAAAPGAGSTAPGWTGPGSAPGSTAPGWTSAGTAPGSTAPGSTAPSAGAAGSGTTSAVPPSNSTLQPPGSIYQPGTTSGVTPGTAGGAAPGTSAGTPPGTFQTPGAAPTYSSPGQPSPGSTLGPPGTTYVPPAPGAALEGTIQAPSADWDPYGTPGGNQPTLLPNDPYFQIGPEYGPGYAVATMRRLLEEVRLDYEWLAPGGLRELGVNSMEIYGTFTFPFLFNTERPLLITPGFAIHFWDGPITLPPDPADPDPRDPADLPPQTFDAYLDLAWNPQITPWLGGELSFRTGIYSDFRRITEDSLRYMGKGMLVLTMTPSFTVKGGIWYLDRNRVKLLPAGGVIWTPNEDIRFEIFFPEPKIARRLAIYYNTEWWAYVRGEYGGGAWTLRRANIPFSPVANQLDAFDYNDLRFAGGLEFVRLNGLRGLFEVGVAFDREIRYRSRMPRVFYPPATLFLRASIAY